MNQTNMKMALVMLATIFVVSNFRSNSLVKMIAG